ncbi:MAG: hypothetical protein JXJ22_15095 [Bacteroidales bacterium]|nr:hypothetical protein [Bacteroidales bacterium]
MSEKKLKILIYITGLFCLYVFIAVRVLPLFNLSLTEKVIPEHFEFTKYGELYYFNHITKFREENLPMAKIKYRDTEKHPKLDKADIITYGDSFFDICRTTSYSEMLADSMSEKVHYQRISEPYWENVLNYLKANNYHSDTPRFLIYETTERYINLRFSDSMSIKKLNLDQNKSKFKKYFKNIISVIFKENSEDMYTLFLRRSYFTSFMYTKIADIKFECFGYLSPTTPVYAFKNNKPWLFFHETVDENSTSIQYQHSQDQINTYCENILSLSKKLKDEFNLTLIFLPVPNKISIYPELAEDKNFKYNYLLPLIYKKLDELKVHYIDLYDPFKNSGEYLYYGTDSHWNAKGIEMAVDKTIEYIRDNPNTQELTKN